jgi:hypothetical protein
MENRDTMTSVIIGISVIVLLIIIAVNKPHNMVPPPITKNECKEDSLLNVINEMKIDIEHEEDGWDEKEKRYESILFDYEFGLDRLKNYHPDAYKDFHRIIGYKEKYSHETERENKKRLKFDKW